MGIDLATIHTLVEGGGERTFLLLNGAGQSLRTWRYVMPGLLEAGRVIRFDPPGIGQSPAPPEPYSFEQLAQTALELAEPHLVGPLIVVGHAWGARAAQVIARDHSPAGVVIGSGGGKFAPLASPADVQTVTERPDEGAEAAWNQRFERAHCAPGFSNRDPERARWLFQLAANTPSQRTIVAGTTERTPLDSYWGRFDCPTLLLYGADDKVGHPENAEDLHSALPNSTLVYIKDSGHFVIVEQGERFAAEIVRWLETSSL